MKPVSAKRKPSALEYLRKKDPDEITAARIDRTRNWNPAPDDLSGASAGDKALTFAGQQQLLLDTMKFAAAKWRKKDSSEVESTRRTPLTTIEEQPEAEATDAPQTARFEPSAWLQKVSDSLAAIPDLPGDYGKLCMQVLTDAVRSPGPSLNLIVFHPALPLSQALREFAEWRSTIVEPMLTDLTVMPECQGIPKFVAGFEHLQRLYIPAMRAYAKEAGVQRLPEYGDPKPVVSSKQKEGPAVSWFDYTEHESRLRQEITDLRSQLRDPKSLDFENVLVNAIEMRRLTTIHVGCLDPADMDPDRTLLELEHVAGGLLVRTSPYIKPNPAKPEDPEWTATKQRAIKLSLPKSCVSVALRPSAQFKKQHDLHKQSLELLGKLGDEHLRAQVRKLADKLDHALHWNADELDLSDCTRGALHLAAEHGLVDAFRAARSEQLAHVDVQTKLLAEVAQRAQASKLHLTLPAEMSDASIWMERLSGFGS